MNAPPERGLPPRIYIPILLVVAVIFLGIMSYFLSIGFRVTGSPFGGSVNTPLPREGPRSTK